MRIRILIVIACMAVAQIASAAEWERITVQTTCEAVAPDACVGAYGFTVRHHRWTAGPSPDGRTVSGMISSREVRELRAHVNTFMKHATRSEQCDGSHVVAGVSERVTIELDNLSKLPVYERAAPKGTCTHGDADAASELHDFVNELMSEHYPKPFPAK